MDTKGFSMLSKGLNDKPFEKTTYRVHELKLLKQAIYQEIMGAIISISLHLYFKMATMALINIAMTFANLWDFELFAVYVRLTHPLTQKPLTDDRKKDRPYNERYSGEDLTTDYEANVKKMKDAELNTANAAVMNTAMEACWEAKKGDDGVLEMHEDMLECMEDVGVNYQMSSNAADGKSFIVAASAEKEDRRTVIMQIAGTTTLSQPKIAKFMDDLLSMKEPQKPDLAIMDNDRWTAIHWACFHGNAMALSKLLKFDTELSTTILGWKDKEEFTPLGLAKEQNNEECVKVIETFTKKSQ